MKVVLRNKYYVREKKPFNANAQISSTLHCAFQASFSLGTSLRDIASTTLGKTDDVREGKRRCHLLNNV